MTLDQALDYASEHLPDNWTISVHVEHYAVWVTVSRADGFDHKLDFRPTQGLASQIRGAVAYCKRQKIQA